jgi:inhibitor of KinA sporulation pathway (predicted exonuclease)
MTEAKYLCVLDFEATCWLRSDDHEIIEFPSLIVDLENNTVVDQFQVFVKPKNNSTVSEFCHELTGITQKQIDDGISFPEALKQHSRFISQYQPIIICTDGDWDLRTMLPADCKNHSLSVPKIYSRWINVKREFERLYGTSKSGGIPQMCKALKIEMKGRLHSGIDDCTNIAQIIIQMRSDGWVPSTNMKSS